MALKTFIKLGAAPIALCAALGAAHSQPATETVTVSAQKTLAGVAGFDNVPLARLPMQVGVTTAEQMKDEGVRRLSDIARLDPSVGYGYNTEGYWDFLTVRGFVIDNRFNYRRDGLPISAETSIPLDNKSQVEILKGTSGMLAGIGSPGGLVNVVVKRPSEAPIREAFLGWRQNGSVLASTDLAERFGEQRQVGLRLNAAYENIDPQVLVADGSRYLVALAGDWRVAPDTLFEAEIENSRRSQPSVPGFSVLGSVVPPPGNPDINLNNQPWSQPSVFNATTGSLRWRQRLDAQWSWVAHASSQNLKSDDRLAFPYGCSTEGFYDRYCSDGTYDLYDYRSDNEKRRTNVIDLALNGNVTTGTLRHALTFGAQFSRVTDRFQRQAFNYAGIGNVEGTLFTPPAPDMSTESTNREARSNEVYLRDAVAFNDQTALFLGLRHTQQRVSSALTDGSEAIGFSQSFNAPWLALTHRFDDGPMLYASWGTGYESDVAPNRPIYVNRGQPLPALKSRQVELGIKGLLYGAEWTLAAFDIEQPLSDDIGTCDVPDSCTRARDGNQVHRGAEAGLAGSFGAWTLGGGAMALQAQREGSVDETLNGLRPTNVPAYTVKLQVGYRLSEVPGLELLANGQYESDRMVLPDNSLRIPSYTRFDFGLRYAQTVGSTALVWRAGVENLFNERAWRESPFQFAHSYLFPLAPRTFTLSLQMNL
jgi:iron complex outermembrane receptor protein